MNTLEAQINTKEKPIFSHIDWIENTFINSIKSSCEEFWEDKFTFLFQSATESYSIKNDVLTRHEMFFEKEFDVGQNRKVTIRFSSSFVGVFLHIYLASSYPKFSLSMLTELESRLFNTFAQFLYDRIKPNFVEYSSLSKEMRAEKGHYNITMSVKKQDFPSGKISLTIPKNLISAQIVQKQNNFTTNDFLTSSTFVGIKAGTTRLTLSELKSLSKDDILLLEDSNVSLMKIKTKNTESNFKVNPDPTLIIDLNEDELKNFEGDNMAKNVWDDIQIEVTAEFNKVKMTLGELKQLTSGLVIDLGDIFDNKISLVVEDKIVAKGNLIIINDKYGVKIDEIISDKQEVKTDTIKTNIPKPASPRKEPPPPPQPKKKAEDIRPQDIENDEDFDYSNVEDGE